MAGRCRDPPGQKEQASGSPRVGSPRKKQAEHRRHREELGEWKRSTSERTHEGRRKRDGRTSFKEQKAPLKKEKEVQRKEEIQKQRKKHRCVVTDSGASSSVLSFLSGPSPSPDEGPIYPPV